MKKLKILSVILVACLALGVFAGCTAADKAAAGELEGTWVCESATLDGTDVSYGAYSLYFEEKGVCYFTRLDVLGGYDSPHYSWTYRNGKLNISFGNYEVLGSKGTWEYKNKKVVYTEKDGEKTLVVTFAKPSEEE